MSSRFRFLALLVFGVVAFSLLMLYMPKAMAQSNGAIAQGFQADTSRGDIVAGALVSTKAGNSRSVELAATDSASRLIGVVDKDPLLVLSANNKQAQVVLSGTTNVLVSDINGSINAGDKITASPVAGVGMAASTNTEVVGTAQTSFNPQGSQTRTVTDKQGKGRTVHIGYISLLVSVSYYQVPSSSYLPPFVQALANSVAGRQVSLVRILFCSILLLIGFVSIAVLIYSSVRTAMISLGRNPLAARDIRRSLYQVGAVAVVTLGGTMLAAYLILSI